MRTLTQKVRYHFLPATITRRDRILFYFIPVFGAAYASLIHIPHGYGLPFLFLLPVIWVACSSRLTCALFFLGIYLGMIWGLEPAVSTYYYNSLFSWRGLGVYLLDVVLLTLPWLILHPGRQASLCETLILLTLLLALLFFPPISIFYWLTPYNAMGYLFPGFGLWALAPTILFLFTLVISIKLKQTLAFWGLLVGLFAISLIANMEYQAPKPINHFIGLNTRLGDRFDMVLETQVKPAVLNHQQVVFLPENFLEAEYPLAPAFKQKFSDWMRQHHAILVSGAMLHDYQQDKTHEGFITLGDMPTRFYSSRQPIPLLSWNPLISYQTDQHWLKSGVIKLKEQNVLISICYEDYLVWTNMFPYLIGKSPTLLVSISNQWWNTKPSFLVQRYALHGWARMFKQPVITAANLPAYTHRG